ncbi:MAG: LpxI family protein [Verrucomicrobiota bacterium]
MQRGVLGIIAGKGVYPGMVIEGARKTGVDRIVVAAFEDETSDSVIAKADAQHWLKVGQLGKLIEFFKKESATHAIMAGQITPKRLFDLKPDFRALILLARLRERNAETIFGAVGAELEKNGIHLLPATSYIENHLASMGWIAGPKPSHTLLEDIEFGGPIAKKVSELDIGQTIVVKRGTVLAVEGYEGTDDTILRGGELGQKKGIVVIKVSKPKQDFRFDVPVIGPTTLKVAAKAGVICIACEAKKTLLLERSQITELAKKYKITVLGHDFSH